MLRFCRSRILKIFSADSWIIQEWQCLFLSYYLYMGITIHMKASLFGKKANLKWFSDVYYVGDRLGKWFKNRCIFFLKRYTCWLLFPGNFWIFFFFSVSVCGMICHSPCIFFSTDLLQGEVDGMRLFSGPDELFTGGPILPESILMSLMSHR